MDNEYFKYECQYIDGLDKKGLEDYLEQLEESINDPFDDGTDLAGDIALSLFEARARERLAKLS